MNNELLIKIAQKGYNVAYGANINFATYDIVKRIPGYVSFLSITVGILGLIYPTFAEKLVSVFILILGIASVYIERFTPNIDSYSNRGIANTDQLNKLKNLYFEVKGMPDSADFSTIEARYTSIENEFNTSSQPNQIVFANWFAHYKMFCEKDMSWMDEQLHFHWWKDKIPMTAHVVIYILLLLLFVYYCVKIPCVNEFFGKTEHAVTVLMIFLS